jgi:exosortase/archaeosortase family protein
MVGIAVPANLLLRRLATGLAWAGCLLWCFGGAIANYLRDQHYQEHFVYLWVFFALALWQTLRGPFRLRFALDTWRDRSAVALTLASALMLWVGSAAGSSTSQRMALMVFATGVALLAVVRWTWKRCVLHGLLLLLCFGVPYSIFFPITSKLQYGVAEILALPAKLGWVGYEMVGHVVVYPHYRLAITADCSGIGQLLTFVGIAVLGVLSSAPNRPRTVLVLLVAVVLAWLSNVVRVAFFVWCVGRGWTAVIDDPDLHAGLGFLTFLPFVSALVWLLMRTHRRLPATADLPMAAGRWPLWVLLVPLVAVAVAPGSERSELTAPPYFARLEQPPGHQVLMRGPSEASDKGAYDTPWLVNARFVDAGERTFDLFYYATNTRSQLAVHKIANCLYVPGAQVRYEPAIEVDGLQWWRLAIDVGVPELSTQLYFAFEVDGQRCDDSWATSWRVLQSRMFGGTGEVRLWRVAFAGAMRAQPDPYVVEVLTWLGGLSR